MSQDAKGKTFIFIDGQNLYLSARSAFGSSVVPYPNFDARRLAELIGQEIGAPGVERVSFYTGMPVDRYSPRWHEFWTNKLEAMEEDFVSVYTRPLRYQYETDPLQPTGYKILSTREKGIDLRIALDVMVAARRKDCDNIVIVSRDQDFREVIEDIEMMAAFEKRDINLWSAYPDGGNGPSHLRGIDGMKPVVITSDMYHQCIDPMDYRGRYTPRSQVQEPSI